MNYSVVAVILCCFVRAAFVMHFGTSVLHFCLLAGIQSCMGINCSAFKNTKVAAITHNFDNSQLVTTSRDGT